MKKWIAGIILALTGASGTYYGAVVTPDETAPGQVIGAVDVQEYPTDKRGRPDTARQPRTVKKYAYTGQKLADLPNEVLQSRTKRSRTFAIAPKSFVTEIVSGEPQYFQDDAGHWWQAEYATSSQTAFLLKPKNKAYRDQRNPIARLFTAYAATDTFYPDPHAETTTVDGRALRHTAGTWAAVRDGNGTLAFDDNSTAADMVYLETNTSSQIAEIDRAFFLFDTSSIPDSNSITAATFSIYVNSKSCTTVETCYVRLVASTITSNTAVAASDYQGTVSNTTAFATDRQVSALSTGAYNDFSMNATGIAAISKTSVTKLGLRSNFDADNTSPTLDGSSDVLIINGFYAEYTGTSRDPKLVVTHEVPTATPPAQVLLFE